MERSLSPTRAGEPESGRVGPQRPNESGCRAREAFVPPARRIDAALLGFNAVLGLQRATGNAIVSEMMLAARQPRASIQRQPPTTAPISSNGYTSFPVPVPGGQQLIIQFYRPPGGTEGATLRFKSNLDPDPPHETPIPAGTAFSPRLLRQGDTELVFSLDGGARPDVRVNFTAVRQDERFDAVDPASPGPSGRIFMGKEFPIRSIRAQIVHPGGGEGYNWREPPPDEAIAPPTWQMFTIPGPAVPIPMYRAVRGRYQGRTIDIGALTSQKIAMATLGYAMAYSAALTIYAIPIAGTVVMLGEAVYGTTILGHDMSTPERVVWGLLALIPLAGPARALRAGAAEEVAMAREMAAARGISQAEARTLVRAARQLSAEDAAFVEGATDRLRKGQRLSAEEATRLANILNKMGTEGALVFSRVNDVEKIWTSGRYWGQTEGAAYGARVPVDTWQRELAAGLSGMTKDGTVIFQGEAANLFHAHEVEGPYSALKRLLGQQKAGFGDIVFQEAIKEGDTIIVTRAILDSAHAGQTEAWALARLWGRRLLIEPLAAAGVGAGGVLIHMGYRWLVGEPPAANAPPPAPTPAPGPRTGGPGTGRP